MKKIYFLLLLTSLASCQAWTGEDKDTFRQACEDDAKHWAGSDAKAHTYCECVLEKMMAKYPDENDALEHIDQLSKDTSLLNCRKIIK